MVISVMVTLDGLYAVSVCTCRRRQAGTAYKYTPRLNASTWQAVGPAAFILTRRLCHMTDDRCNGARHAS